MLEEAIGKKQGRNSSTDYNLRKGLKSADSLIVVAVNPLPASAWKGLTIMAVCQSRLDRFLSSRNQIHSRRKFICWSSWVMLKPQDVHTGRIRLVRDGSSGYSNPRKFCRRVQNHPP